MKKKYQNKRRKNETKTKQALDERKFFIHDAINSTILSAIIITIIIVISYLKIF